MNEFKLVDSAFRNHLEDAIWMYPREDEGFMTKEEFSTNEQAHIILAEKLALEYLEIEYRERGTEVFRSASSMLAKIRSVEADFVKTLTKAEHEAYRMLEAEVRAAYPNGTEKTA